MIRNALLLAGALASAAALLVATAREPAAIGTPGAPASPGPSASTKSCAECHRERHPGMMAQWDGSRHAAKEVACEECHGDDHDAIFSEEGRVPAARCQGCHPKQTLEFRQSVHARALPDALENARLLAQIPAMQRRGCLGCHGMGGAEQGGRCDDCHGAHRFSAADARRPEACGTCHLGPDHPQIEAYEASKHGVAFAAAGDEAQAPTCAGCHMPSGTHDVSGGITIGRAGSGAVLEGETPPIPMRTIPEEEAKKRRESMLETCVRCHSARMAREALEDADEIKREADRLLAEAVRIVTGLYDDRLLDPMPEERLPHPTAGHALVLGGPALYENHSEPERIFFDLAKFAHAITFKGAYHQSPDHTHWLGIARLKEGLEALRGEERRLRRATSSSPRSG